MQNGKNTMIFRPNLIFNNLSNLGQKINLKKNPSIIIDVFNDVFAPKYLKLEGQI